jgi:chromosome segregation ATPase
METVANLKETLARTQSQLHAATDKAEEERSGRVQCDEEIAQLRMLLETKHTEMAELKGQLNKEASRVRDLEGKLAAQTVSKAELEERLSAEKTHGRSQTEEIRALERKLQVRGSQK